MRAPEVRTLGADDAQAFSALRRLVTADNPIPMGLTFAEELTRTQQGFREQLSAPAPNATFCFREWQIARMCRRGVVQQVRLVDAQGSFIK